MVRATMGMLLLVVLTGCGVGRLSEENAKSTAGAWVASFSNIANEGHAFRATMEEFGPLLVDSPAKLHARVAVRYNFVGRNQHVIAEEWIPQESKAVMEVVFEKDVHGNWLMTAPEAPEPFSVFKAAKTSWEVKSYAGPSGAR